MKTIWALLVGIDKYQSPIPPLAGCVNDIEAIHKFLQTRVASMKSDPEGSESPKASEMPKLEVLKLLNHEATRENIISNFRSHLSQAKAGDVALFYYSGHGAQEEAAEEFWPIEPDHLNETLVAYDSRRNGVYDLADKELAQLIAEVSANNPHLLVVLDCCHSGSGTRAADGKLQDEGFTVRRAPLDRRKRPMDSYIFSKDRLGQVSAREVQSGSINSGKSPHVLLAGCRPDQTSKEAHIGGQQRGAFSAALMQALEQPGSLGYRDLLKRVENHIKNTVPDQNPQIELLAGQGDELFLGGAIPERPAYFTLRYENQSGWTMDGGGIHGIPPLSPNQNTKLAVYAAGSDALGDLTKALGVAVVGEVEPDKSVVELKFNSGSPDTKVTYWGIVTEMAVQPLRVVFEGDELALKRVRLGLKDNLYASEAGENPEYRLLAKDNSYWITLPGSTRPLTAELVGYSDENAAKAAQRLEHIARWRSTKDLANPTSKIAGKVQMKVYDATKEELLEANACLTQTVSNGKLVYPAIKVKIKNTSQGVLYCSLLSLSESFAVEPLLRANNSVERLEPGQEAELNQGKPLRFGVPDELWNIGITERTDLLKLVVSTENFDADLLRLDKLDFPTKRQTTRSLYRNHPLQRLMRKAATRESIPDEVEEYADWCTQSFSLTIVRPQASSDIDANRTVSVGAEGAKIAVKPHPLKAKVGVATKAQATRSAAGFSLPAVLRDNPQVQPLRFASTREAGASFEVLELTDIQNPQAVTPENPLELELPISFDPSTEQIIPLAIHKDENGREYYLPLGFAEPAATRTANGGSTTRPVNGGSTTRPVNGGTTVKIEYLPNLPTVSGEERTRSLFNSLRMMFFKIVGENLGVEVKNQTLSAVEVAADGTPTYVQDVARLKRRVDALQPGDHVLLYIHGILGKTKDMVGSVVSTPTGLTQPISQHYKLILAYDYENLNTSIKESGQRLREKLIELGLGPNHGKNLHIVAHSMGGLVSRWFVEHEGGGADRMVQRLVMLGTPNGGSPWLNLKEWVTHLLTLALNGLAPAAWVSAILNGALWLLRSTTTTTEMKLGSTFIRELGTTLAPNVKYAFIAGDARLQGSKERQGFVSELLNLTLHTASQQLFQGQPNDLAASVESVLSPLSDRDRPDPIGSDHFSYFVPEVGLGSLARALE